MFVNIGGVQKELSSYQAKIGGVLKKVTGGFNNINGVLYPLAISNLPKKGLPLENYTWEEISLVAAAGEAKNYWNVGDTKSVQINGTIGTLSLNATYYVYIIGFDHNGATNTIDFGTFKTAEGIDICLIDGNYTKYKTDGTKLFNMNHSSNTNDGGWKGCDLRYDILGSTNVNDGDATPTTATSPVSDTLMAALPSDLRAVMKPMTIYTDNTGGGSDTASNVTSSVDYLPLLAEFEISGTRSCANSAEQEYQKQYSYYSSGNSIDKNKHSETSVTASWWARSPDCASTTLSGRYQFCYRNANGLMSEAAARYSFGLAPIFRV